MLAATAARAVATDHEVGLEELRLVVMIPEKEWERLAEQCRALRDEMEASGKYLKSELMQVQAALCCVCDYTTRPELRAAAVDRVHSMFKRENKPPDADTNEAAEEEAQLKDHTTLDLMKRIKGAGGAS